jgi:phage-related protein
MREIKFFRTSSNRYPVEEFLDSLTAKQAQKVTWVMRLVEEIENVPDLYLKKLNGAHGIWEIRIQANAEIFRVLGFFDSNNFIATNGFCKKSQKTPTNEISLAKKRKCEYMKRGSKHE